MEGARPRQSGGAAGSYQGTSFSRTVISAENFGFSRCGQRLKAVGGFAARLKGMP